MRSSAMLGKALACAGSLAAVMALSGSAHAEAKTHDGFYLSMNVGVGYLSSSADYAGTTATFSGVTIPSAIWLGGTVGPVVIGGGLLADYAPSPSMDVEGGGSYELDDVSLNLLGFCAFADIYPDPHGGFHVMPFAGWGGLEASQGGDSSGSDPTGLVMGVGAGYDFWVANEWSLGAMARFAYAPLSLEGRGFSTISPALLFTATYH